MHTLTDMLALHKGSRVSVVGCGGKTSIIELLARQNQLLRILITPTTQISAQRAGENPVFKNFSSALAHKPQAGIQYAGLYDSVKGKLNGFETTALLQLASLYDIVFMEADGSRGLPCKGWNETEPVVPSFSTHTVGVVTLNALNKPATEKCVHRLPVFLTQTGLKINDLISLDTLARMVAGPGGMFKNAKGKVTLIINQVETPADMETARELAGIIRQVPGNIASRIICGSAHQNIWHII